MTGFLLPHGNKWHKIVFGLESVNFCDFFAVSTTTNSINCLSLDAQPALDKKFLVDRVINV